MNLFLFDEPPSFAGSSNTLGAAPKTRMGRFADRFLPFTGWSAAHPKGAPSPPPPTHVPLTNKEMRALRVVVRLSQPFCALLLAENPGEVATYRRVAAETLIMVKLEEITPAVLNTLESSVRVLEVL